MKAQFVFNGRKYIAPSKQEAEKFLSFWDAFFSRIHPIETGWKIETIERAPGWVPVPIDIGDKIEYS